MEDGGPAPRPARNRVGSQPAFFRRTDPLDSQRSPPMTSEDRSGMSVALTCKDMSASVAFYKDKLGFRMKESFPEQGTPMWCNMVLDGQSVMLGAAMDPDSVEGM